MSYEMKQDYKMEKSWCEKVQETNQWKESKH